MLRKIQPEASQGRVFRRSPRVGEQRGVWNTLGEANKELGKQMMNTTAG